jgi:hypothetical protein
LLLFLFWFLSFFLSFFLSLSPSLPCRHLHRLLLLRFSCASPFCKLRLRRISPRGHKSPPPRPFYLINTPIKDAAAAA